MQLLSSLGWKKQGRGNVTKWSGHGHPAEDGIIGLCPWAGAGIMDAAATATQQGKRRASPFFPLSSLLP